MSKADELVDRLKSGWASAEDLRKELDWLPHTLRGAISTIAKKRGLKIERRRENGITSYRIEPEYDANKDVEGCFSDAYAAIRDRVAAGGPGWEPK